MEHDGYRLMRIYVSSTDKVDHRPLYEAIVFLAKEKGLQGATVHKGIMGFGGSSSTISSANLWEISEKLPVVVEIVDTTGRVEDFQNTVKELLDKSGKGSMIVTSAVDVTYQRTNKK